MGMGMVLGVCEWGFGGWMDGWRGGFVDETKSLLIKMDVRVEISRPTPLGY